MEKTVLFFLAKIVRRMENPPPNKSEQVNLSEGGSLFNELGEWDEHISKIVQSGESSEIPNEKIADQGFNALLGYVQGVVNYGTSPLSWLGSNRPGKSSPTNRSNQSHQKPGARISPSRWGLSYVQSQISLAVDTITYLFLFPVRRRNKPVTVVLQGAESTHTEIDVHVRRRLQLGRPIASSEIQEVCAEAAEEINFVRCRSSEISFGGSKTDAKAAPLERGQSLPTISSATLADPLKEQRKTGMRRSVPVAEMRQRRPQRTGRLDDAAAAATDFANGVGAAGPRRRTPAGAAQLRMAPRMPRISPEAQQWCAPLLPAPLRQEPNRSISHIGT